MITQGRVVEPYAPLTDLTERHPRWQLLITDLDGVAEMIHFPLKRIYLDRAVAARDPELAIAHAIAHLDLHTEGTDQPFTPEQERQATWLAQVKLDRFTMA